MFLNLKGKCSQDNLAKRKFYKERPNLKKLNLSSNNLISLNENTFEFLHRLEELNISENKLKTLDENLFNNLSKEASLTMYVLVKLNLVNLNSLKILDLSNNNIVLLDEKNLFQSLVYLKRLDLGSNKINNLDNNLFQSLVNLQWLNLGSNQINLLDNKLFQSLINLQWLNLGSNQINHLDKELFQTLVNLETLGLGSNKINNLDKELFETLVYLQTLDLESNQINHLDKELFQSLVNLQWLNLGSNQINHLDNKLFQSLVNLQWLNLESNQINHLDKDLFKSLVNLQGLSLGSNRIDHLDKELFQTLVNLETLGLGSNKINHLDKNLLKTLVNLVYLYLDHNQVNHLDKELFQSLVNLQWLNLGSNKIKRLELDDDFFMGLVYLDVSSNNLTKIQINDAPLLKRLILFNNKLNSIKINSNSLQHLDISSNQIKLTNQLILECPNLVHFKANRNKFETFDLRPFPLLKELFLQNNSIQDISFNIGQNKSLEQIHLYGNNINKERQCEIRNFLNTKVIFSIEIVPHFESISIGNEFLYEKFSLLQNFKWPPDLMSTFNVITGKNGCGKSTLLKFIKESLEFFYTKTTLESSFPIKSKYLRDQETKLLVLSLKINHTIEAIDDETFFGKTLEDDKNYTLRKVSGAQTMNLEFKFKNKANIFTFRTIKSCLKYLRNQLDDVNKFLSKKEAYFKYKQIEFDLQTNQYHFENNVAIENLSPGEHLMLLLLLWEFIYERYEVYGKTILLFDEPDAHLHPSAIPALLRVLTSLSHMNIQIIMTTHNPTTTSFISQENLLLLYHDVKEKRLCIKRGIQNELSHHLCSSLVNVEKASKSLFCEGQDASFYSNLNKYLVSNMNNVYKCAFSFQLHLQPLSEGHQNKKKIIDTIEALGEQKNKFFAIVDDDGDAECNRIKYLRNLFYLRRYAKDNYVLDPVNVYFYLKRHNTQGIKYLFTLVNKKMEKYSNYSLNDLIESLYGLNGEQEMRECVRLVEIIHETFFQLLKDKAVEVGMGLNERRRILLFKLQLIPVDGIKDKTKKDKNKTQHSASNKEEILDKLKSSLIEKLDDLERNHHENVENTIMNIHHLTKEYTESFIQNKTNLSVEQYEMNELLTRIKDDLSKLKGSDIILNYLNKSSNMDIKIVKLNWENVEAIVNVFKIIDANLKETLLFDLDKCTNETGLLESRKNYLNYSLKPLTLTNYLRLKSIEKQFDLYKKYQRFEAIDREKLEQALSEPRSFYINRNKINTRSFFINFQAHELEKLVYQKFFDKCGINCESIVNEMSNKGFFVPDELVHTFKSLSTNLVELDEENFEYMVFNGAMNWFVLFTNTNDGNVYTNLFNLAIELNGRANVGIFVCTDEEIGTNTILNKTQIDKNDLATLAYFNNEKSLYKKCAKSYDVFKTYAELIKYCVDKLEENIKS